ncbi:uncharacterized protein DSM5745_09534 [Aspergillus mulundensis]|uniref:Uncharacterized protein n=1 Tax=Aspergillus mulundensis TaxID=1810919 RepID=A0A3D8QVJ5_9EURO|nr:Uncharacterized protein DSM5745_09534 [Aspergillus mulundensis]RDW65795.1 Uncharacterized protein DSM5745_09534 [Aspergillus mulundensis]
MTPFTISALRNLPSLTSDQRTALIDSIAKKMTTTMITVSQEIENGNLDADNTAPMHKFIRVILRHDRAHQRKLERKVERYQRRARLWRAERRRIQSEFAEIVQVLREALMEKTSKGSKARPPLRPNSGSGDGSCGELGESKSAQ